MKKLIPALISVAFIINSGISFANTTPKGVYSGGFGEGKATLFIDSVNHGKVVGTSLYKDNKRPFAGTLKSQGNFWRMDLNEPATRTGDGYFDIRANRYNPDVLIGTWKVFPKTNSKTGIAIKTFHFKKTQCAYDPFNGSYDASYRLLKSDEMYTDPDTLDYMRNEIFARHGYSFKSDKWASRFSEFDWYVPCSTNVDDKLTKIEKENIQNIKKMRKYMVANPSLWGR